MPRRPSVPKTAKAEKKELDKEIMYQDYVKGMSLVDISKKHEIAYRTLLRYSSEGDWENRRDMDLAPIEEAALIPKDVLQEEAISKTLRVLHKIASDTEKGLFSGDPDAVRMNVKTMVDAIDKLVRLKMHVDSGGISQSQVHVKKETIDWNKAIEMSIKAKKENPNFDEEEFLRNVLDGEVVKK